MTTATVTLEPQNIAAAVQSLQAEFAKADMLGVETVSKGGDLHVKMAISRSL